MLEIVQRIGTLLKRALDAGFQYSVALNHLRFGEYRKARRALGSARVAFVQLIDETLKVEEKLSEEINSGNACTHDSFDPHGLRQTKPGS